ncbi:hypothetical protein A8L45_12160 [Veronia pacifica]|uniref:Uncharacterized protein n=1 Tax=Veronia pacifica TaxID=1080227 RepID=A0A1C3EII4_9GAMM|nr:hypothetical protein A8L45_12160 [Veronia pacifica]
MNDVQSNNRPESRFRTIENPFPFTCILHFDASLCDLYRINISLQVTSLRSLRLITGFALIPAPMYFVSIYKGAFILKDEPLL